MMQSTIEQIVAFILTGGLSGFLSFKLNKRKEDVNEWVQLLSEYKEQVKQLKEEVHALREELAGTRDKLEATIAQKTIYELRLADKLNINYDEACKPDGE